MDQIKIDNVRLELAKQLEFEQLKMRIYKLYDIEIESMEISPIGAGSLIYFVTSGTGKYVVKYPSDNEMNHPEQEASVCSKLVENGIPACKFIKNRAGNILSTDECGRRFTLQHFYEGTTYHYNAAPRELQAESAAMLAKIHSVMKDMDAIPEGIGANFIKNTNPAKTYEAYKGTLNKALECGDKEVADLIRSNMEVISKMPNLNFDINRFTCGNTHGDYTISQLIWSEGKISGVIDWTCACRHPYIWEIVRSYVFMAGEVADGYIDIESLTRYIEKYLEGSNLNPYDIENAGNFFFYFLAVCNFYGQYYDSIAGNRHIYLDQATMATKLLLWFEDNLQELNKALSTLSSKIRAKERVKHFYDENGKLISYPTKKPLRELVLADIASEFETGRRYTEKEVNGIIKQKIAFSDVELIRREMYEYRLLDRLKDGSAYWKENKELQ